MSKPAKTLMQQFAGDLVSEKVDNVRLLYLEDIRPFGHQVRERFDVAGLESLAASIKLHGLQQPITVRLNHDGRTSYELIAGERRWRACKLAGVNPIPALVHDLEDRAAMEIHLAENLQRADLNPIEEAKGYRAWLEQTGETQAALGKLVGKSQSAIANTLRLLELPDATKARIISGEMSAYHGRLLLSLKPGTDRERTYVAEVGYVEGATLPEMAPKLKPAQLEEVVKRLNAQASGTEYLRRQTLGEEAKAEDLAEKERAEHGGDVRAVAESYGYPEDVDSRPSVSTRNGNLTHPRCSEACPHPVWVARGNGSVHLACGDLACREEVEALLEAQKKDAQTQRAGSREGYRKTVWDGLTAADRRRLALYLVRLGTGWKSEEDKVRIWASLPETVSDDDVISALAMRAVKEAVDVVDYSYGIPDHGALRVHLAHRFNIPPSWILGEKPEETQVKIQAVLNRDGEKKAGKGASAA